MCYLVLETAFGEIRMKIAIRNFLVGSFLTAASPLLAAPVGNPAAPKIITEGFFFSPSVWADLRLGYEGDFVSDAKMEQQVESSGRVDGYSQSTNSGTVTLNILNRLDLFGVFGSSKVQADWRFSDGDALFRIEMETHYDFLWAAGARAVLFEWGKTSLGLGARYSASNYTPTWLTTNGASSPVSGSHFEWKQWQVNLGLSYNIDLFTPYIGGKYSSEKAHLSSFPTPIAGNDSGSNHFKNRQPVGLYLGCSLSTGKLFMLNVEGRLIDEEAVTISGDFRF